MATILDFPQTGGASDARPRAPKQCGTSAEIVLFPGVRYERWEDAPQARKSRPRRKAVKRDTLDILE